MDFFDVVSTTPPEAPARRKSFGEELTEVLAFLVFPCLTFLAVIEGFAEGALLLPPLFAVVTFAASRWLRARPSNAAPAGLVCALASLLAGVAGTVLGH